MDLQAIETKLAAARTRLILEKPFLGALVLRLPMVAADSTWCQTTATDARSFYYNPEYIQVLRADETQFVLAHEALHCALSQFHRRQHRLKHRWDLACDFAINPLLIKDGLTAPPGSLVEDHFGGMTAEEIYPCLDDRTDEQDTLDRHVYDRDATDQAARGSRGETNETSGAGARRPTSTPLTRGDQLENSVDGVNRGAPQPLPLTPMESEALSVQWQNRLAGAAQQALQAGKLTGAMARMVDELLQPQLPWRMLLARFMSASARDDYNFSRPSSRRGEPAILPSLRSSQINMVVALDVSGSVSAEEMGEFLSEIDALKGQLRARISLLACDAELSADSPWEYEPWEEFNLPRTFQGGGGTRFGPVFDWAGNRDIPPDLLVYFTDAAGVFPETAPSYPVIWLVKGKAKVPWGQRIQLN